MKLLIKKVFINLKNKKKIYCKIKKCTYFSKLYSIIQTVSLLDFISRNSQTNLNMNFNIVKLTLVSKFSKIFIRNSRK